jgi:ubiquinone/menaquinone biosynthesis C-methylase UbiE
MIGKSYIYICPVTGGELTLRINDGDKGAIRAGYFESSAGLTYPIMDGVPDFTYPRELGDHQKEQLAYYEANAEIYDDVQGLTFAIQNENEEAVRQRMVSYLHLERPSKVLELACGTGRDSAHIAAQLGPQGQLFVQDLSAAMLKQCRIRLKSTDVPVSFSVGNASYLPFPDGYFDAVFSFGGLNVFDDIKSSLREMVRVTKPGGRIVVGDESMPPWLYETEFGKTLLHNNPLFSFKLPLEYLPVEARDVAVRWIIGGVYYLISFTVGEGEPVGNFDLEIPGRRGGTLRTRYRGQLEGVTEETKEMVLQAARQSKMSIHKWLDQALRAAAEQLTRQNHEAGPSR